MGCEQDPARACSCSRPCGVGVPTCPGGMGQKAGPTSQHHPGPGFSTWLTASPVRHSLTPRLKLHTWCKVGREVWSTLGSKLFVIHKSSLRMGTAGLRLRCARWGRGLAEHSCAWASGSTETGPGKWVLSCPCRGQAGPERWVTPRMSRGTVAWVIQD